jgi:hypothetical protein
MLDFFSFLEILKIVALWKGCPNLSADFCLEFQVPAACFLPGVLGSLPDGVQFLLALTPPAPAVFLAASCCISPDPSASRFLV